ncbi:hypothetical protein KC336_g19495 [Hortaea werneckii]|nr:hypothetical protein KC336_g19495 [Hortaea werneckii]
MDSGDDLSKEMSGLNMMDSGEETSTRDGSSEGAMGGEGQRVSDEGLKDLPDKVHTDNSELLKARDYTTLFFGDENVNGNIKEGASKVTGWFIDVTFEDCLLDNSNITGCRMTNVNFRGCTFKDATWAELRLDDVDFEDCVFENHLWRCRSLSEKCFEGDFLQETSLGEDIPLEIDAAFWVKEQQYAFIAASEGGDAALARYIRAEEEAEHDRKLATQSSTKEGASSWPMPDARACQDEGFQAADAARRAAWVPSPMNTWG